MWSAAAREVVRLGRASAAGLVNTLFGYGVIFGAMALGLSPYLSNALGYGLGFICSFVLHKKFVFASEGNAAREFKSFLLAFLLSYLSNLAVLHASLRLGAGGLGAQLSAAMAYLVCMYALSRAWVFRA